MTEPEMTDATEQLAEIIRKAIEYSECDDCAEKALAALDKLMERVVPEGWQAVPKEATYENGMKEKLIGEFSIHRNICEEDGEYIPQSFEISWVEIKDLWKIMLAAAPKPAALDKIKGDT